MAFPDSVRTAIVIVLGMHVFWSDLARSADARQGPAQIDGLDLHHTQSGAGRTSDSREMQTCRNL
jgi:hypothetical protein